MSEELPDSWCATEIANVLETLNNGKVVQQGWSPQCEKIPALTNNEWGVLKTTAVQSGYFLEGENKKLPEQLEPRPNIEVQRGDILMTCAGPRNRCGVACLVKETRPNLMMSGKMYRFRANEQVIDPKYLEFFLVSHEAKKAIDKMKTGISDSGLNLTHSRFLKLPIPVAPINKQYEIVSKIEELISELETGIDSLKISYDKLQIYRKAVLKDAFEGKYTSQFRKGNSDLPDCSSGVKKLSVSSDAKMPSTPEDWKWVPLESITNQSRQITYGVIKLGKDDPHGVPTLRSSDVRCLKLDLENVKKISKSISDNYQRTILQGGEVLVTIRGTLGGVAVIPKECAGYNISREVAMISPAEGIYPEYLSYYLASVHAEIWFKSQLRGVAYTGINLSSLRNTPVPICSFSEQQFIVNEIEDRLSKVNKLEESISIGLAQAEILRQSILMKAFSGKLVVNDPNDEPASVLLERIKTEKADAKKKRNAA